MVLWAAFLAVFAAGVLISHRIKKQIENNGIETDAVVSRVVDEGQPPDTDIYVYVRYRADDGEEAEAILSNPASDLEPGQQVRIKYHPKLKTNARLLKTVGHNF